jgi:hypothetical protein
MPDKNPAADRWGGPGGGGENAKRPRPEPRVADDGEVDDTDRKDDSQANGAPE